MLELVLYEATCSTVWHVLKTKVHQCHTLPPELEFLAVSTDNDDLASKIPHQIELG
jgi:hypothetical protein